jgi:uracil-DNA glycosylase family 4
MPANDPDRSAVLGAYHLDEVMSCTRCPLHATRTQAVPGSGNANAQVMFVGEAPGYHEDRLGIPFVGQAGKLLDQLLEGIGLGRDDVFIANVLKCRPPENRDPLPAEIAACQDHLFRQVEIIRPRLICTLGNFATKLLSGRPDGISRVHGCELEISLGGTLTVLYPLYHPAAALYMPAMRSVLQEDFARIPLLIAAAGGAPRPPDAPTARVDAPVEATPDADPPPTPAAPAPAPGPATQLDLF